MGTLKIPFEYDVDTLNSIGSYFIIRANYDNNGESSGTTIMSGIDDNYVNFQEGKCPVIRNGKYGFIDTNNNIILPFIYDAANNFEYGYAIVALSNKFGIIDSSGNLKIPCIYDLLIRGQYSSFYARLNGESFTDISLNELSEQVALRNRISPPLQWLDEQRRD